MKKSKFFTSAIIMMNRLKYPQKFALISAIFILPLSLLMYLLISEIQTRNDFAEKEILGNEYLRTLHQLSIKIPEVKRLQILPEKKTNDVIKSQIEIEEKLQELIRIDQKLGQIMKTGNKVNKLQQNWQNLQKNVSNFSGESKITYYNILLKEIDDFRSHIGNESNLILDPDLDTYYLMDATLLKLPVMEKILAEIKLLSAKIMVNKQINSTEKAQLIILLGQLQDYNDELKRNIQVAFTNNPAGNLQKKLSNSVLNFTNDIQAMTDLAQPLIEGEVNTYKPYFQESTQNIQKSSILWNKLITELDILLEHRINGFVQKQLFICLFVVIILGIVVYLFMGFYTGVMQTISALSEASKAMIEGTLTNGINLNTQDELAEVVKSFNNIATELVKTHQEVNQLNLQLKSENLRMSTELEITRRLQEMILPKESELKKIDDLDIAGFMLSANEVGGDYYDVMEHNGMIKIGMGDVTGHGLESGVLMIMVQTAVRTLLASDETDPVKIFTVLNKIIYENVQRMESDKNLTLVLLDYMDGLLHISGQHEETIVVRNSGKVERIDTIDLGFPIGLDEDISNLISSALIKLDQGDVVVLYTDGITEAENMNKQLYGLERLIKILEENYLKQAQEIRKAVINDVHLHIGTQIIYDDITLLVIKKK